MRRHGQSMVSKASVFLLVGLLAVASACSSSNSEGPDDVVVPPIYIQARILSLLSGLSFLEALQVVHVCTEITCATGISTAVVTVNGTALTFNNDPEYHGNSNEYEGNVLISPGSRIALSVVYNGSRYEGNTTQFAENQAPTLTLPTAGSTWFMDGPNFLQWNAGTSASGATWFAGIRDSSRQGAYPRGGNGHPGTNFAELPIGTTKRWDIPANSLRTTGLFYGFLGVGTQGIGNSGRTGMSISNAAPGSSLTIGLIREFRPINVIP